MIPAKQQTDGDPAMKKKTRKALFWISCILFAVSTVLLLRQYAHNARGSSAYENALAVASGGEAVPKETVETILPNTTDPAEDIWIPEPIGEDPNLETLEAISLEALRERNPDVAGWIWIPDTKINYPLMQGTDNDYYLHHTWERQANSVGSIFLEHRNSPDLTDYNTIVYGHNMNNGSMFGGLRNFAVESYCQDHPWIYLLTDSGIFRYEVFAAYRADVDSATYGLSFREEKTRAAFLIHALESSQVDTGVAPELTDRILTLSTCSGAGYTNRWVVQARLKMVKVQ